jgi:hypothetical protein
LVLLSTGTVFGQVSAPSGVADTDGLAADAASLTT